MYYHYSKKLVKITCFFFVFLRICFVDNQKYIHWEKDYKDWLQKLQNRTTFKKNVEQKRKIDPNIFK